MFLRRREIEQSINLLSGSMSYASAAIGDILLTDKSFATLTQWNTGGYLPAIGVIFGNASGVLRVLSLTKSAAIKWDTATTPLNIAALTNYSSNDFSDVSGNSNTAAIIAALGDVTIHAAGYCYNYVTDGTLAHDWYLPAIGELSTILQSYISINTSLTALSANTIKNNSEADYYANTMEYFWGSTENNGRDYLGDDAGVGYLYDGSTFLYYDLKKNNTSSYGDGSIYARACLQITY